MEHVDTNILLSHSKIIKVFKKYKVKYDISILDNKNQVFIEFCKILDIDYKIIKNCINTNEHLDYKNSLHEIIDNLKKSNNVINYIKILSYFINKSDIESNNKLSMEINNILHNFVNNKSIYSSLKSLLISINKNVNDNEKNNKKKLNTVLEVINYTKNIKRIIFYVNKINIYIDKNKNLDFKLIIDNMENIIRNKDLIKDHNIELILNLINKCKNYGKIYYNDLEILLSNIDNNIYNYIYFINNKECILNEKNNVINFLKNLDYEMKSFKEIDILNLKRGFIQGLVKNNNEYILKYQPNKSLMELVINSYIKKLNKPNFLIPDKFYINDDCSYFYIISKYSSDLYKYFNILELNHQIMNFKELLEIYYFLINSIEILHDNNIIHSDLKPENIVINLDDNYKIKEMKIIDFDVSLFNHIPEYLKPIPERYERALNNKKIRGTRIYMLKSETMTFHNDIYSLGVILIILLYKNIKLIINLKKNGLNENIGKNKKIQIKYNNIIKKLNKLKEEIENNQNKIKIVTIIEKFLNNNDNIDFYDDYNDNNKFKIFIDIIKDCIDNKLNINELKLKYKNIL